jgi:ribosomal protein L11 methyltransferase
MIEFHINTTSEHVDELSDQLALLGAAAVTWQDAGDQPIYEPKPDEIIRWNDIKIIALFESLQSIEAVKAYLVKQQQCHFLLHFEMQDVEEKDWVRITQQQFEPVLFGKRLWIIPSWCQPVDAQAVNILFDAGVAFGTGSHPTTALCLEWLEQNIHGNEIIIDYGCGAGILAVSALKLGAKHAVAIDYDPQAIDACLMNAELNDIPSSILEVCLPENLITKQVDILLANILAQPLIELAPRFADLIKPGGRLVLSGIMNHQCDDVLRAYQKWFSLNEPVEKGDWVLISARRIER